MKRGLQPRGQREQRYVHRNWLCFWHTGCAAGLQRWMGSHAGGPMPTSMLVGGRHVINSGPDQAPRHPCHLEEPPLTTFDLPLHLAQDKKRSDSLEPVMDFLQLSGPLRQVRRSRGWGALGVGLSGGEGGGACRAGVRAADAAHSGRPGAARGSRGRGRSGRAAPAPVGRCLPASMGMGAWA